MMKSRVLLAGLAATLLLSSSLIWAQTEPKGSEPSGSRMQQQGKEPGDHKGTEPWGPGARGDAEQQAGREDIRRAQEALKAKGLDPGPANGMMGPETEAALKVFQQREGLPVTGRLDDKTKQALGLGTGATRGKGGASPSQGPRGDTQ